MNNKSLRNHFSKNFYLRQEGIFELTRLDETNTPRYNIEEINISLTKINLIPSPSPPPPRRRRSKNKATDNFVQIIYPSVWNTEWKKQRNDTELTF